MVGYILLEVVGVVRITTLTNRQYCVILDPVDDQGLTQLGEKKLVKVIFLNVLLITRKCQYD